VTEDPGPDDEELDDDRLGGGPYPVSVSGVGHIYNQNK
jgi:hypothetical protein